MLLGGGAAATPFFGEAAMAQLSAVKNLPPDAVKLNANENPLGPAPEAIEAMQRVLAQGGRYSYGLTDEFRETMAAAEGLSPEQVLPFAGSSAPLTQSVLAFTSPTKKLRRLRSRLRSGRVRRQIHRRQNRPGAAHQDVRPRRAGDGRHRQRPRADLRLQPEQPDRHTHARRRDRLAGRKLAGRRGAAAGRGLHAHFRRPAAQ